MTHAELIRRNRERTGATGPDPLTERVNADGTLYRPRPVVVGHIGRRED